MFTEALVAMTHEVTKSLPYASGEKRNGPAHLSAVEGCSVI